MIENTNTFTAERPVELLALGAHFLYAGVEWVKLDDLAEGVETKAPVRSVLAISVESLFQRAFDKGNRNDWRTSTLRVELNNDLLSALRAEGAKADDFVQIWSDLTADDGKKDYGSTTDTIALLTCGLYRKYSDIIPPAGDRYWTSTPWSCNKDLKQYVRCVNSSGALGNNFAYGGDGGVRPLCCLRGGVWVSTPPVEFTPQTVDRAVAEIVADIEGELRGLPPVQRGEALARALAEIMGAAFEDSDQLRGLLP